MNTLLIGTTDGGNLAVLIPHATWDQVRAISESLEAAALSPIRWSVAEVAATHVNGALLEVGMGDVPLRELVPT